MTNKTIFQSVCNLCQVRSLVNFEDRYLLIANGNCILTYLIDGSPNLDELIETNIIFSSFGITKILVESPLKSKHFVISLGNRFIAVNRFLTDHGTLCQKEKTKNHINLHDWALDATFQSNCDDIINIVSASNRVTSVNWKLEQKLYIYECTTSCILYSAKLLNSVINGQFIVLCGTVFKQILIWIIDTSSSNRKYPVAHSLHSHDGVIFDIDYCAKYNKLASASDDRSIRVWNYPETDHSLIETPEHVLYGHQSRVWCVKFVHSNDASYDSLLVSGGEDGCAYVWNHMLGTRILSVNLSPASLWSVALSKSQMSLFYGSNYGRVVSYDLISSMKNAPTIPFCEPKFKPIQRNADIITSLCWIAKDTVLYIDKTGAITLNHIDILKPSANSIIIKGLNTKECFDSYSIMAISGASQIAIGDKFGKIYLFEILDAEDCIRTSINYLQKLNGHDQNAKICGLEWLNESTLLSSDVLGRIKVWKVDNIDELRCIGTHQLPKSRHSWITTAILVESIRPSRHIVVGDRSGGVHFYKEGQVDPQNSYPKLHGLDGVSSVQLAKSDTIYTTGRDGRIMELNLIEDQLILMRIFFKSKYIEWSCRLILDPQSKLPIKVIGFHSTYFVEYDLRLNRVSWSVPCGGGHRLWLYYVEQEGGTSHFIYNKHGTLCRETKYAEESGIDRTITNPGGPPLLWSNYHSSQIRCCAIITRDYRDQYTLFATGGDDNLIVIQAFNNLTGTHSGILQTLYGHISSVKSLTVARFSDSDVDYLLTSGGGRSQVIFWQITLSNDNISSREIKNISIDDFENPKTHKQMKQKLWKKKDLNHDGRCGEARIMGLSAVCEMNKYGFNCFSVACANSDAKFRLFELSYDPNLRDYSLELVYSDLGDGSCLNAARLLSSSTCFVGSNEGSIIKYSKKVDGVENRWEQVKKWRSHSRGVINISTIEVESSGHLLVASVGDDNQVSVIRLLNNYQDAAHTVDDLSITKYAHDAQASGVVILDKGQHFLSCSVDQRVTLWKVKDPVCRDIMARTEAKTTTTATRETNKRHDEDANNYLVPVVSTISSVADITGCCILSDSSTSNHLTSSSSSPSSLSSSAALYIIIYGFGMEILKLQY